MSSANHLVGCNLQEAFKSFKVGKNIIQVSNSFDLGETQQSYSALLESFKVIACFPHVVLMTVLFSQ